MLFLFILISVDCSAQKTKTKKKVKDYNGCIYICTPVPEFPGGEDSLMSFLQRNIDYPKLYLDSNIKEEIRIFYNFDVNRYGKIETISYDSTFYKKYPLFIKEGFRAFKLMQKKIKWKVSKNITWKTRMTIPISFDKEN